MAEERATCSDPCFVFAKVLDGRGGAKDIDEVSGALPAGTWLHIDYAMGDVIGVLSHLGLSEGIVDGLTRTDTRPRSLVTDAGVLLVLRCVNNNPGADPEDMVSLRIWITGESMITVRQRRLFSIQELRDELDGGTGPCAINEVFTSIIERSVDRIGLFVDQLEDQVEQFEDQASEASPTELRPQVTRLRRQTAVVRRYVAPMREALSTLDRTTRGVFESDVSDVIHEQADRIMRFVEDLDLVREKCIVVHEELNNRIAQDQNARMYVLSLVAAIFLPITFISGVFGMNVAGLPGLEDPDAFLWVMGIMAAISVGVLAMFRFRRWF